jgi:hypothetical protein
MKRKKQKRKFNPVVFSKSIECNLNIQNKIKKIRFDLVSKKVFDEQDNYLGHGELNGHVLIITNNSEL